MADKVVVAVVRDVPPQDIEKIKAVDPDRLEVVPLWRSLRKDTEKFFSETHIKRFERPDVWMPVLAGDELERVLNETQAVFAGGVHPSNLRSRMPNVRWAAFSMAGLSTIAHSDFWSPTSP